MKYTKIVKAGQSVDKDGKTNKSWSQQKVTVDGTELMELTADLSLRQHLSRYIKLMSQHDASSCHRGARKTGDGPGWSWNAETSTLTLSTKVWEERESSESKKAMARAAAEAKIDELIAAKKLNPETRAIVLAAMGF